MAYRVLPEMFNKDLGDHILRFMGPSEDDCKSDYYDNVVYQICDGFVPERTYCDFFRGTPGFVLSMDKYPDFDTALFRLAVAESSWIKKFYFGKQLKDKCYEERRQVIKIMMEMAVLFHGGKHIFEMFDRLLEYAQYYHRSYMEDDEDIPLGLVIGLEDFME